MIDSQTEELTFLTPFFQSATQHAAIAIRRWTSGQVNLSLDDVNEAPMEEIASQLEVDESLQTMVVLGVQGEGGGQLILAFDEINGRKFAASLVSRAPSVGEEWSELEKSAIMETGNIFGSAYLSELTRLTKRKLLPSAPFFVQDFGVCVLEQALMTQAMEIDRALICRTRFEFNEEVADWNVYFVPDEQLLNQINRAVNPQEYST